MKQHGDPLDQQIRGNINKIAFLALAFMAVIVLLSVWFFIAKKPAPGAHSRPNGAHVQTQ